jgi:hypothetical protein
MKDLLRYDKMVEAALRGVVREALARVAANGLPGAHHFYITFKTGFEGVEIPASLRAKHPEEMTIVLEHQFWGLEIEEDYFTVTLSFQNKPERLVIPFEAILSFADPAVKFGLQFQQAAAANEATPPQGAEAAAPATEPQAQPSTEPPAKSGEPKAGESKPDDKGAEVVNIEKFRKK